MRFRKLKALATLFVVLGLTAASCDDPGPPDECFEIDGAEICGQPGGTTRITFGIRVEDADNFLVRIHEEDAQRYHLEETIQLVPLGNGTTKAIVERLEPGPSQVCLRHNLYLEDTVKRERTILFPAGECTLLSLGWGEGRADWMPY